MRSYDDKVRCLYTYIFVERTVSFGGLRSTFDKASKACQ